MLAQRKPANGAGRADETSAPLAAARAALLYSVRVMSETDYSDRDTATDVTTRTA